MSDEHGNDTWDNNRKYILTELNRIGDSMKSVEETVIAKYDSIMKEIQEIKVSQAKNETQMKVIVGSVSAGVTLVFTAVLNIILLVIKRIAAAG